MAKKVQLTFLLHGAYDAGDKRHAQLAMRELGIQYEQATPQSMGDQWWFWNCTAPGDLELPSYIVVSDRDPMKCIGYGLSAEDAKRLTDSLAGEGEG